MEPLSSHGAIWRFSERSKGLGETWFIERRSSEDKRNFCCGLGEKFVVFGGSAINHLVDLGRDPDGWSDLGTSGHAVLVYFSCAGHGDKASLN